MFSTCCGGWRRSAAARDIITTAHAINEGDPSLPPVVQEVAAAQVWCDLNFIAATDAEDCLRKVQQLVTEFIPRMLKWPNPIHDVQILAPMHKGVAGVGFQARISSEYASSSRSAAERLAVPTTR